MCILDLRPGQMAVIDNIKGDSRFSKRLQALGCIKGTEVTLKTCAPFGDPLIINLRGFNLAIRRGDARNIEIKGE